MGRLKRKAASPMTLKQLVETYSGAVLILLLIIGGSYYYNTRVPKSSDPALTSVELFYNQNDFLQANRVLDEKLTRDSHNVSLLLAKAATLAQEGSLTLREKELGTEARIFINRALAIEPNSPEAYTLLGYTFEIQENYLEAYQAYDIALDFDPQYTHALVQKAHAKQLEGMDVEARRLYESALKIEPNNLTALLGMARIYSIEGKYVEAKKLFLEVAVAESNIRRRAEAFNSAARVSEAENPENWVEAETLARKATEADPSYPQAYVSLARAVFTATLSMNDSTKRSLKIDESFSHLDTAINLNQNLAYAHLQLATQLYFLEQYRNAQLILGNLPQIIDSDISLNKNEKNLMKSVVANLSAKLQ